MSTTKKSEEPTTKTTPVKAEKKGTTRTRKSVKAGLKKNFILDTNVILHDYKCLDNFEENDIYIPFIVLEQL